MFANARVDCKIISAANGPLHSSFKIRNNSQILPPPPKSQASLTRLLNAVLGFTVPGLPKSLVRPWHRHCCDVFDVSSKRFFSISNMYIVHTENSLTFLLALTLPLNHIFFGSNSNFVKIFFVGWYWSSKKWPTWLIFSLFVLSRLFCNP